MNWKGRRGWAPSVSSRANHQFARGSRCRAFLHLLFAGSRVQVLGCGWHSYSKSFAFKLRTKAIDNYASAKSPQTCLGDCSRGFHLAPPELAWVC